MCIAAISYTQKLSLGKRNIHTGVVHRKMQICSDSFITPSCSLVEKKQRVCAHSDQQSAIHAKAAATLEKIYPSGIRENTKQSTSH